jgi:hypothetical protein
MSPQCEATCEVFMFAVLTFALLGCEGKVEVEMRPVCIPTQQETDKRAEFIIRCASGAQEARFVWHCSKEAERLYPPTLCKKQKTYHTPYSGWVPCEWPSARGDEREACDRFGVTPK